MSSPVIVYHKRKYNTPDPNKRVITPPIGAYILQSGQAGFVQKKTRNKTMHKKNKHKKNKQKKNKTYRKKMYKRKSGRH
jgi:hypothetical protein